MILPGGTTKDLLKEGAALSFGIGVSGGGMSQTEVTAGAELECSSGWDCLSHLSIPTSELDLRT